jgi:hypothetical protein
VYGKFGIIDNSQKTWLPKDFLGYLPHHSPPINVLFDVSIEEKRWKKSISNLAKLL